VILVDPPARPAHHEEPAPAQVFQNRVGLPVTAHFRRGERRHRRQERGLDQKVPNGSVHSLQHFGGEVVEHRFQLFLVDAGSHGLPRVGDHQNDTGHPPLADLHDLVQLGGRRFGA